MVLVIDQKKKKCLFTKKFHFPDSQKACSSVVQYQKCKAGKEVKAHGGGNWRGRPPG